MSWRKLCRSQREKTLEERFWGKVQKRDGGCWIWTGCKDKNGYGFFRLDGKNVKAHRLSLVLAGQDPGDHYVCHSCDIPACVNPQHLWVGDNSTNQIDASKKGRHAHQKLTVEDVREIRRRREAGESGAALAREFGLSGSGYIRNIMTRRKWAHVD